jgi:hypothetical protein
MRIGLAWLVGVLFVTGCGFAAWSVLLGQTPPPPTPPSSVVPAALVTPAPAKPTELSKLTPLQQQMYVSVHTAADWLFRVNRSDGRFIYGYLPAVNQPMEGDHYLRQIGAAFALARAARFTKNEKYVMRATEAVLTLLIDTQTDPADAACRHTRLPNAAVNRLAAAGLLVLAIHELPSPKDDLLEKSDQLCQYIRKMQRDDGSLCTTDNIADTRTADDAEGLAYYPGEALYGLMRSQQHRPAAWKSDLVKKALAFYKPWWQKNKSMAFVPWQTAAYTEAFLLTKDQEYADFVNEMNDWLCGLQFGPDPRRALWMGGFMGYADGQAVEVQPTVASASFAESLAEACRVARQAGDVTRHRRYSEALEHCLQFLTTLQYTESNTQHFASWYRPQLVGAFRAASQDGNLRIDYTQHAVSAMTQYLVHVVQVGEKTTR